MILISDTNILGSLAAGTSLPLLFQLFPNSKIYIPSAVYEELKAGIYYGEMHLQDVLDLIDSEVIKILTLSPEEKLLIQNLPSKLNAGECEGIALSHSHKALFLSNDKGAIRYCREHNVKVMDLSNLLRLLWVRKIISRSAVKKLIRLMTQVEGLTLTSKQFSDIFARVHGRRR